MQGGGEIGAAQGACGRSREGDGAIDAGAESAKVLTATRDGFPLNALVTSRTAERRKLERPRRDVARPRSRSSVWAATTMGEPGQE